MQAIEHVLSLYVYTTTIQRIIPVRIVSSLTRFDFTKKKYVVNCMSWNYWIQTSQTGDQPYSDISPTDSVVSVLINEKCLVKLKSSQTGDQPYCETSPTDSVVSVHTNNKLNQVKLESSRRVILPPADSVVSVHTNDKWNRVKLETNRTVILPLQIQ